MRNDEKIYLAVDGSPSSRSAAFVAAQIAAIKHWSLHAVYVVDITQAIDMYGDIEQELSELGDEIPQSDRPISLLKEQGNLALMEIKGICNSLNVPLTTDMIAGSTSTIVLETSSEYSLLALGRQGNRHQGESQHLGSNFREIAHRAEISLLIGGREYSPEKIQHILLAYDGSEHARHALQWAESLRSAFSSVMTLSIEKEDETKHDWLNSRKLEITNSALANSAFTQAQGEAGPTIASVSSAKQMDLILMGGYRHSQLVEWATHSTLNKVLRECDIPILAAK